MVSPQDLHGAFPHAKTQEIRFFFKNSNFKQTFLESLISLNRILRLKLTSLIHSERSCSFQKDQNVINVLLWMNCRSFEWCLCLIAFAKSVETILETKTSSYFRPRFILNLSTPLKPSRDTEAAHPSTKQSRDTKTIRTAEAARREHQHTLPMACPPWIYEDNLSPFHARL